jgi:hypothetical protein
MTTRAAGPPDAQLEWHELIAAVRADLAGAIDETTEMMRGLSYRVMDDLTLRSTVTNRFEFVLDALPPGGHPGSPRMICPPTRSVSSAPARASPTLIC